jgi:hypothetical protein
LDGRRRLIGTEAECRVGRNLGSDENSRRSRSGEHRYQCAGAKAPRVRQWCSSTAESNAEPSIGGGFAEGVDTIYGRKITVSVLAGWPVNFACWPDHIHADAHVGFDEYTGRMHAPKSPASAPSFAGKTWVPPPGIPFEATLPGAVSA